MRLPLRPRLPGRLPVSLAGRVAALLVALPLGLLRPAGVAAQPMASPPAAPAAQPVVIPGPGGVALRALLALPPGGAPSVPVIAQHGCGGIAGRDGAMRLPARERDWLARLLQAGHAVVFPDSFGSRGAGPACGQPGHPVGAEAVRAGDALAAATWAQAQPWARPGGALLLGWSHGGSTVLAAAAAAPPGLLRGAVAFYPGCGAALRADTRARLPVLLLLGAADDWTRPAACHGWAARQPAGLVALEEYPGAGHGFDAPGAAAPQSRRLPDGRQVTAGPHPEARALAVPRALDFLAARSAP